MAFSACRVYSTFTPLVTKTDLGTFQINYKVSFGDQDVIIVSCKGRFPTGRDTFFDPRRSLAVFNNSCENVFLAI